MLPASQSVTTVSDADSAAVSSTAGTTVDVPRDAGDGVSVTGPNGASFTVTPPLQGDSSGTPVAGGVVAYPGGNGASTAVQATDNGGVRMLTVISDQSAPTDYTYNVDLPAGGSLTLNPDGTASLLDSSGTAVSVVQAPWAKDANGKAVPTSYSTDGHSLTQHVDFHSGDYALPITADPWFWSYVSCITGVGVPIGAAIAWVSYVGAEAVYVIAVKRITNYRPGGPAWLGPIVKAYAGAVYRSCRAFINS